MNIRYVVTLTAEERQQLGVLVHGGKHAVRMVKRAQILLAADDGSKDEAIAQNVAVGTSTVYRTKQALRRGRIGTGAPRGPAGPRCRWRHGAQRCDDWEAIVRLLRSVV